ncbi:MAG: hypothetical protein JWO38_1524 [Gemmataceae bacterium]|nr:hypothetical protein [Gemmataceae bacterium]
MTPDPTLDKLVRFTPDAAVDPAEILFRAGRASVRTPRGWRLAVVGLLLANAATAGVLIVRGQTPAPPPAEPLAVPVVVPVVIPAPAPELPVPPTGPESPWSVGALTRTTDPDTLPGPEPDPGPTSADRPLTLLSARRGEID